LSFPLRCDKSSTMIWTRVIVLILALALQAGCTGGGSGSTTPTASWEKFRHDLGNTGVGIGGVVKNPGGTPTPVSILWSTKIDNNPISASPAIGINNTLFVGSEGGILAALNLSDGTSVWPSSVDSCGACPSTSACNPPPDTGLGTLISSPAVYNNNNGTNIAVASKEGNIYAFQFSTNNNPVCVFCFQPACTDSTLPQGAHVSFISSPNFTINPNTFNVAGVFIGAVVTDGSGNTSGRLYALNANGSIKWQFPRVAPPASPTPTAGVGTPTPTPGQPSTIGAITSSPAIGLGSTVYFTTDDGFLYALTSSGNFLWRTELAGGADVSVAPSAVANATNIIASSANGVILALNTDGSASWGSDATSGDGFASSLAVGPPAQTPSPTPGSPTPVPLTPTLTPVPGTSLTVVVGVRTSGRITLIDAATGVPMPFLVRTPIAACATPRPNERQLCSSPALSSDGYIIVGDQDGLLHAISTLDGAEPNPWNFPIALVPNAQATPAPIRSSPALDGNGVAYVGSDDGYVYAVGPK